MHPYLCIIFIKIILAMLMRTATVSQICVIHPCFLSKSILHYRYKNSYTQDLKDKNVPIKTSIFHLSAIKLHTGFGYMLSFCWQCFKTFTVFQLFYYFQPDITIFSCLAK